MTRCVAIQGFAPDSRNLILDEPESTEIWGMNNGYKYLKGRNPAKHFQLHPRNWNSDKGLPPGEYGREPGHVEWLKNYKGELFLQEPDERIPDAKVFPYTEVVQFLNRNINRQEPYLTSTFAMLIGYALYENSKKRGDKKINEIKIFGINLSTAEEYFNQRPGVEFLAGYAMGAGIKVWIPPTSAIFRGRQYARNDNADLSQMFHERVEYWRQQHQDRRTKLTSAAHVIQEVKAWISTLQQQPDTDAISAMSQRLGQVRQMAQNLTAQVEGTAASYREAQHSLASTGQMHIPETEFQPLVLPNAPIGYDVDELEEINAGSQPDSAGVGPNAEPVTAGQNGDRRT